MKYQVITGADGRITCSSSDCQLVGAVAVDMPEGFASEAQNDWRLDNGVWVYDPLPHADPTPDPMATLAAQNTLLAAQVQALTGRGEFLEDCIAEMAMQVYGV